MGIWHRNLTVESLGKTLARQDLLPRKQNLGKLADPTHYRCSCQLPMPCQGLIGNPTLPVVTNQEAAWNPTVTPMGSRALLMSPTANPISSKALPWSPIGDTMGPSLGGVDQLEEEEQAIKPDQGVGGHPTSSRVLGGVHTQVFQLAWNCNSCSIFVPAWESETPCILICHHLGDR